MVDACAVGNVEVVVALASHMGMEILTQAENYIKVEEVGVNGGKTALHAAAAGGFLDVVQYLVEVSVPVDVLEVGGRTPLWMAAQYGEMEAMALLIELGADVHKADNNAYTPLLIGTHPTPQKTTFTLQPRLVPPPTYTLHVQRRPPVYPDVASRHAPPPKPPPTPTHHSTHTLISPTPTPRTPNTSR